MKRRATKREAVSPAAGTDSPAEHAAGMDAIDRRILSLIQTGFPLVPRPYAAIGNAVGLDEEETFERVRVLRERGIIRRLGAHFNSWKLGFKSTLATAKVPEAALPGFIEAVNRQPGVTHNYLRAHAYNVWFTVIERDEERIREVLEQIRQATGIRPLSFPATKLYKIRVDFPLER